MRRRGKNRLSRFVGTLICFLLIALGVFIFAQYITKTGLFKEPGIVYYDDTLNDSELELLHSIFTDEVTLDADVVIVASNSFEKPELSSGEYLYSVLVPVTDFYSSESNINMENPDATCSECDFDLIDVDELTFEKKLLSLNNKYYLNDFSSGAIFRVIKFTSDKFDDEIFPLVNDTFSKTYPEKDNVLSLAQTGVTALSRGMNAKLYNVQDATYFAEKIKDYLSAFDLTHTSNESSFSDFASSSNICSDKRFINTLTAIGLDIVELTGNHNQDCGDDSALGSIDTYNSLGIKMVGGGKSASEAAEPLEIDSKGSNITFLAYNLSTGGATYDNSPGANQYYEEDAIQRINAAKAKGDFVLVDIQYYECNAYASTVEDYTCDYAGSSAGDQVGFFRHLVDLGADMVVGTSAHQPQTFELYGNGVIYYGLGNLFFDQIWWPGTTRSLVLENYFYKSKLLQTKITPTIYDNTMQTRLMDQESANAFIERLVKVHP